ncbi:MAG: YaiO family outer membrane beta-barrel protein [Woeseia sp.]
MWTVHSAGRHGSTWLTLIAAAFLCTPAQASADVCEYPKPKVSDRTSGDPAQRYRRARSLAADGEYDAAIQKYRALSAEHPRNVDYLFGEAQVRFWSGNSACTLELLHAAKELAPGYEALWQLEYQVLRSDKRPGYRDELDAFRSAVHERFPGAAWLRAEQAREAARWGWETGLNRDRLDNGAADWQNIYAYLDRRSPSGDVLSLKLTEHRRFSLTDNELALAGALKLTDYWILSGAIALSPDAAFLAESVVDFAATRQLKKGWLVGADVRQRRYAENDVSTWGLNVERYFGKFRAAWHIDNTRLSSSSSFMYQGVLDYYASSGSRYAVTIAAGDEVEIIAPGQLLEMEITAVAVKGQHPLSERLSVLWRLGTHRQGSIYRRSSVGLSIAGEF